MLNMPLKNIINRKENGVYELDMKELIEVYPEEFDFILESPEKRIGELKEHYIPQKEFDFKITNIPDLLKINVSNVRARDLNKLVFITGILKKVESPIPRRDSVKFECSGCGSIITVNQETYKLQEPNRCSCGKRGNFKVISENLVDFQELELEENIDDVGSRQPQKIKLLLEDGLTDPSLNRLQVGNKVDILGVLVQTPKYVLQQDLDKNTFDYSIKVIQVNTLEAYEDDIDISEEELEQIKKIAQENPLNTLSENIAPGIYGLEKIKRATVLFMAKGVNKSNGFERRRGDIHMLVVGEAGLGKSALIENMKKRLYNCRIADGKDATKAGMVATVVKDQITGKWVFEAGELVLSNGGYLIIDEADKLSPTDRDALHRPMEQGVLNFSKASVKVCLKTETSVYAVANPKTGKFEDSVPVIKQINFSRTLFDRFDLVFILKDKIDIDEDTKKAERILQVHSGSIGGDLSSEFIKKYFLYCSKLRPKITPDISKKIQDIWTGFRKMSVGEGGIQKGIPVGTRMLEGLIRLSEAHAKIRLSEVVEDCDVDVAEGLLLSTLSEFGLEKDGKTIDMSGTFTKVKFSKKQKFYEILEIMKKTSVESGDGLIFKKDIISTIQQKLELSYSEVEELIDTLHSEGEIIEPKINYYKVLDK
jgi:replicative DNA helicase Mcm